MDYEQGLAQLKQLLRGTTLEAEFLIYEARLRENLREERLYGSNEQRRSERGPIIYELNRLAKHVNTSFNDLCLIGNGPNLQTPPNPRPVTGQNAQGQPVNIKFAPQRIKAYISFSERDETYLDELHSHLDFFVRKGTLDYWDRSKLLPGSDWRQEINKALNATKVAILLISADFLALDPSEPIASHELPALLPAAQNQEIVILNVIVRPCSFEYSDLEPFQAVNPPGQPLSQLKADEREKIWVQLAKYVRDILNY
jgi:hypothetical protein